MAAVMAYTTGGLSHAFKGRHIKGSEFLAQGRVRPLASARCLRARRFPTFHIVFYPNLESLFTPGGYTSRLDPPIENSTGSSLFHFGRCLP